MVFVVIIATVVVAYIHPVLQDIVQGVRSRCGWCLPNKRAKFCALAIICFSHYCGGVWRCFLFIVYLSVLALWVCNRISLSLLFICRKDIHKGYPGNGLWYYYCCCSFTSVVVILVNIYFWKVSQKCFHYLAKIFPS